MGLGLAIVSSKPCTGGAPAFSFARPPSRSLELTLYQFERRKVQHYLAVVTEFVTKCNNSQFSQRPTIFFLLKDCIITSRSIMRKAVETSDSLLERHDHCEDMWDDDMQRKM